MSDFRYQGFGTKIRRWRRDIHPPMTQRELARQIGVSDGFLAHIETGRTLPGIKTLRALARSLGISETQMLQEAGYLSEGSCPSDEDLLPDPELRLFFRQDWQLLSEDEKEWFKDFVRLLKTRHRSQPQG